mgnify:CR=1 FL=1
MKRSMITLLIIILIYILIGNILTSNNIISANLIRKLHQENKDITPYIPRITNNYLYKNLSDLIDILYKSASQNII